jgi:hypothetical protein
MRHHKHGRALGRRYGRTHVTYAERSKLPDSAFALPSKRHLGHGGLLLTNKSGKLDAKHIHAAAARLSMMRNMRHVTAAEYSEAHGRIVRAAHKVGTGITE